ATELMVRSSVPMVVPEPAVMATLSAMNLHRLLYEDVALRPVPDGDEHVTRFFGPFGEADRAGLERRMALPRDRGLVTFSPVGVGDRHPDVKIEPVGNLTTLSGGRHRSWDGQ